MKRLWALFALLVLLVSLVPAALAQEPAGAAAAPSADVDMTLAAASGGQINTILDDFNRANGPIGPNWTVHSGSCNVSNNAAVCSGNAGRATFNGAPGDGNVAEADIATDGTASQYTGLLLNYGAGVTNLFLKVQQQNASGQFHVAGCYIGNNQNGFGLGFFTLDAPFSTAHMKATRVGNDVTIEFTNVDGGTQPDQTYVCTGAPAPEGTGIGILGWNGIARLDNFGIPGEEPIVWDKTIDGISWTPDISITRQTSDTIVVQEVLHLTPPPPPPGPTTVPMTDWQPNLPVAPIPSWRTPETVGGTPPPQALPAGTPRPLQATGLLYLTSLDIGNATFAVYDPATNSWTTLAPYETGCQMAVDGSGQLYAHNFNAGTIDVYNPATDTWSPVMPAPPGGSGQYCNLEITNAGEFLYTEFNNTTLWYTSGGAWNTLPLPFTTNAMGDYDPLTDQYVVGEAWTTNAHMIDVHTWVIADFASPVPNGEYARFSVVLGNRYYFEANASNIHSFDLGSPGSPPLDHGVSPGFYTSAAGDRVNSMIFVASLDSTALSLFDPATNLLTPLTGYGISAWHSSVAYAVGLGPTYAQIETWDPAHLQLVDWEATGGTVISESGRLVWTGQIVEPEVITLTKWFHVEPCTWTQTLLWEELWLDDTELEQRPVLINKLPPELWIDSIYDPIVCPGMPAQFMLDYGNLGGYENDVMVRNDFPPEAPFAGSDPPPDNVDPNGLWAEWLVGDLAQDAQGRITVTVDITSTASPGDLISVYDWIIDHVGEPADETEIVFEVGEPDITVDPLALWVELCPELTGTLPLEVCNVGDCPLEWEIREMTPTLWLSEDPISGTLPAGLCQTITVSFDAAGLLPGDYFADLLILSNDPDEPQVALPVTLTVQQPVAILDVTTVITDLTVAFFPDVTGTLPIDYGWAFGDGMTSTEMMPVHTYDVASCYTVTLDVTNACGTDNWTGQVCVSGACQPVAILSVTTAISGCVVDFGAELAGTAPFTYDWDFGPFGGSSAPAPTVDFAASGTYPYTLTALNCGGAYSDSYAAEVTVACACEPVTHTLFTWTPLTPTVGQAVTFTASAEGTPPITFAWDFGDGATGVGAVVAHTYAMAGTYSVTLTATNCLTATETIVQTLTVAPRQYSVYLPLVLRGY